MIYRTHCALRLGDNLAALHFLRKLAQAHPEHRFIHHAHLVYIHQLSEVVCDLSNLQVCDLESVSENENVTTGGIRSPVSMWEMRPRALLRSVDTWKNAGGFWESHPLKLDYAQFYLGHCLHLAERMELQSPIRCVQDILFDYPALARWEFPPFDCLVINSPPMSGQMPLYNAEQMDSLCAELARKMSLVTTHPTRLPNVGCTQNKHMTVSQIGSLSRFCRVIVMVSTGPSWATMNIWNLETIQHRVILNGSEQVNLAPNTVHARSVEEARKVLQLRGLL